MKQKLCFLFALLLIAIAGNAKTSKDVNGDGVTNVSDVTALVNQIIGSGNYSADVCDVNGDGVVNVSDVTSLINVILGNEPGELAICDINADGELNVSDVTALINSILD